MEKKPVYDADKEYPCKYCYKVMPINTTHSCNGMRLEGKYNKAIERLELLEKMLIDFLLDKGKIR